MKNKWRRLVGRFLWDGSKHSWSSLRNPPVWINIVDGTRLRTKFQSTRVRMKPSLRYKKVKFPPSTYMLYMFSLLLSFRFFFFSILDLYFPVNYSSFSIETSLFFYLVFFKKEFLFGKLFREREARFLGRDRNP